MKKKRIGSLMTATAIMGAVFMAAGVMPAMAADGEAVIADTALKTCINTGLGQEADAVITTAQAEGVSGIDCRTKGVTSLEGLQAFKNLKNLDVNNNTVNQDNLNKITDLTPISGLTSLTRFVMENNSGVNQEQLAGLVNLESVGIWGAVNMPQDQRLKNIDFAKNMPNLEVLEVSRGVIEDLTPLTGSKNLAWVSLAYNKISDITPLKDNAGMVYLLLSQNQNNGAADYYAGNITDISALSNMPELDRVDLYHNDIVDFAPMNGKPYLTSASFWGKLGPMDLSFLETSKNMMYFSAYHTDAMPWNSTTYGQVSNLEATKNLVAPAQFSLEGFGITEFPDFAGYDKLTNLNLSNNKLTTIAGAEKYGTTVSLVAMGNQIVNADVTAHGGDATRFTLVSQRLGQKTVKAGDSFDPGLVSTDGGKVKSMSTTTQGIAYDAATGKVTVADTVPAGTKANLQFLSEEQGVQSKYSAALDITVEAKDKPVDPGKPDPEKPVDPDKPGVVDPEKPGMVTPEKPGDNGGKVVEGGKNGVKGGVLAATGSSYGLAGIAGGVLALLGSVALIVRKRKVTA